MSATLSECEETGPLTGNKPSVSCTYCHCRRGDWQSCLIVLIQQSDWYGFLPRIWLEYRRCRKRDLIKFNKSQQDLTVFNIIYITSLARGHIFCEPAISLTDVLATVVFSVQDENLASYVARLCVYVFALRLCICVSTCVSTRLLSTR